MKCAKIPAWVKNPIGGRIVGANDARQPIPWQVLITNALKGEKKRLGFSIESTKSDSKMFTLPEQEQSLELCRATGIERCRAV